MTPIVALLTYCFICVTLLGSVAVAFGVEAGLVDFLRAYLVAVIVAGSLAILEIR